jgi:hypothetical protein
MHIASISALAGASWAAVCAAAALSVAIPGVVAAQTGSALQDEVARGKLLESEVEAELRRQEELLRSIDVDKATEEALNAAAAQEINLLERADTRMAPKAPVDRRLPSAIFDSDKIAVQQGQWGSNPAMNVTRRSLDADRDGKPEEIRYLDVSNGQMVRKESDRDYDGAIDTWQSYSGGAISSRQIDSDGDGKVDQWEKYARGRMTERSVDRDLDGRKDAYYRFSGDSLVEEKHDNDEDGNPNLVISYRDRHTAKKAEDRTKNGRIDTWVSYSVQGDKELPVRIERDTDASGKVDIIEEFDISSGEPIIAKREEDKNGDGTPDITSIYKNGKLSRREISDPDLVDL